VDLIKQTGETYFHKDQVLLPLSPLDLTNLVTWLVSAPPPPPHAAFPAEPHRQQPFNPNMPMN
jgi:hypothetical protein